jgi:hypothetical protein
MTLTNKLILSAVITCALFVGILFTQQALAGQTQNNSAQVNTFVYHQLLVATTTTATSTLDSRTPQNQVTRIDGAKKVDMIYSRTGRNGNEGSSNFFPQVSYDGTVWFYYAKQVEYATSSLPANAIALTLPNTVLTSTTTKTVGLDITLYGFKFLRCVVVETTDGEHSCDAAITF